jgi:hypothetical protein
MQPQRFQVLILQSENLHLLIACDFYRGLKPQARLLEISESAGVASKIVVNYPFSRKSGSNR